MATSLGELIRARRTALEIGVRELARLIDKSPAYVVSLERAATSPGATDDTLAKLAEVLDLSVDELMAAAGRIPASVQPQSGTEVSLHRLIGYLSKSEQEELLKDLEQKLKDRLPNE